MITLANVRKSYGAREVLHGVSLSVREGTVTALIGPNGSGKTTLIKILLGLARVDEGDVHVDGAPLDANGDYRKRIGYLPQIARFPEHLRVRDLLSTVDQLRGHPGVNDDLFDDFQLARELHRPLGTLSGGTRQKVNAVMAFRYHPTILILDEPTTGLDPVASKILKARIRRARTHGATVIVTSHVLSEVQELADDIAYLCEGQLQFTGTLQSLFIRTGQLRLDDAVAELMGTNGAPMRTTPSGASLTLVSGGPR